MGLNFLPRKHENTLFCQVVMRKVVVGRKMFNMHELLTRRRGLIETGKQRQIGKKKVRHN